VWGQLRPASHSTTQYAILEFQAQGSKIWTQPSSDLITTDNSEGFFMVHLPIPGPGSVRLAWVNPGDGKTYYSRTVSVA
jgi:hypothetical protein